MPAPDVRQLLAIIDSAYDVRSWHGPNLRGSIRGVTPPQAVWRPMPGAHNIHELVVHAAYWKYVAVRRLTGAKRGSFPLEGSNFFERDAPSAARWKADLSVLDETHAALRDAVARLSARELAERRGEFSVFGMLSGVAAHDLYHAGQIQLLKRLQRSRS